jgi:hypothetical protein
MAVSGSGPPTAPPNTNADTTSLFEGTKMELAASQRVVALTADTAAIQNPSTGNVLTYRKVRKPALGPLAHKCLLEVSGGDALEVEDRDQHLP